MAKFEPRNGRFGSSDHCCHCKISPSRVYVDPRTDLMLRLFWQLLVLSKAGQNECQCLSHEVSGVKIYYHVLRISRTAPYLLVLYNILDIPMTSMIFLCQILRFVRVGVGRLDTPSRENLNAILRLFTASTCYYASSHLSLPQI